MKNKSNELSCRDRKLIFFIGPVRCGTTWLYSMFKNNTQCSYIPGKEIYYFEKSGASASIEHYFSKFVHRSNIYVDLSPTYIASEEVAKKIKAFFPDCLIVIIKRNPADIAVSLYKYIKRNGKSDCSYDEFLTHQRFAKTRNMFRYSVHLPIWKKHYRDDQIVCLDYCDFQAGPEKYFFDVCRKLGLTSVPNCRMYDKINDSLGQPRMRYVYRAIIWLGRNFQTLLGRSKMLRWKMLFDKIMIDKSVSEYIPQRLLRATENYFSKDRKYIENI